MLKRVNIEKLDDYFVDLSKRKSQGVYFYRLGGYNSQIHEFIKRYYDTARLSGVIIEDKLQNPDNNQLSYYNEIMGANFQMSLGFLNSSLKKWLPRMNNQQRESVATSLYDALTELKKAGKTDNILKNAYIKFMCWLYYKFERIVNHLGEDKLPKLLYDGEVGTYELLLLNVLCLAGCDIVLLQYHGDASYLKADPSSSRSSAFNMPGLAPFPPNFSLKQLQKEIQESQNNARLYGPQSKLSNCTNAWISGNIFEDVRKSTASRGSDANLFYNCFCRIRGAENASTYQNDLYLLQRELKSDKRQVVIVSKGIAPPSVDEINAIKRKNYQNSNQLITDLATNIRYAANAELRQLINKAFVDVMLQESEKDGGNMNRLTNKAVYLLCWLKRYQQQLFGDSWKTSDIACFLYMGGCKNDNEAMFCRMLARLPIDVLIFTPNLDTKCCLEDKLLYEINNSESLDLEVYPENNAGMRIETVAHQAERQLTTVLYQDSGMYRNLQYSQATSISLQTIYEEIAILWSQELKYRPNFSTDGGIVTLPVIFSKVCGVPNGDVQNYWKNIKELVKADDVKLITKVPAISSSSFNPLKAVATDFWRNNKLYKDKIKAHKAYQYGFLRDTMQDYLLDKLQTLIEQRTITGTGENGTEYTIISVALNLEKDILRMIQKFDFTKKNPKVVYVITGETVMSLEDTIQMAFLNLVGFDVVLFVPTGYQCAERYLSKNILEEHHIGDYVYDLKVPNLTHLSWCERLFKRGK